MKPYKLKLNVPSGKLVVASSEIVHKAFPFSVDGTSPSIV
jgi:hypothetical protein